MVAIFGSNASIASWWPNLQLILTLPWIALLTLSVGIDLVSSSARVTSVKSQQGVSLTDGHPDPKIGPQVYLGPIKTLCMYDIEKLAFSPSPYIKPSVCTLLTWWHKCRRFECTLCCNCKILKGRHFKRGEERLKLVLKRK